MLQVDIWLAGDMTHPAADHLCHPVLHTGGEVVLLLLLAGSVLPAEQLVLSGLNQLRDTPVSHADLRPVEGFRVDGHQEQARVVQEYSVLQCGVQVDNQIRGRTVDLLLDNSSLTRPKFKILKKIVPLYVQFSFLKINIEENLFFGESSLLKTLEKFSNL